jgi:hypothetical protein
MPGKELTELEHPGIAEDVVGRAPYQAVPDNQADKEWAILAVRVESTVQRA